MEDHEIATKLLSDWKPEQDIILQKAFGKFVEEVGELLEATAIFNNQYSEESRISFENEIADCFAFIRIIRKASGERVSYRQSFSDQLKQDIRTYDSSKLLLKYIGISLKTVGRCQIQGLSGKDPESKKSNIDSLSESLGNLFNLLAYTVERFTLIDNRRVSRRIELKVNSKLPWVMGTATDLLPST